ncbi:MAG: HNH endonuclease [Nanoarchaeota archaeon]|nr:HNH endonuclease [Nanoarchaeota archaeon]
MPKGIAKNGVNKGWFKKGEPSLNKGKKLSDEHKRKLKIARRRIPGRNTGKRWKLSIEIKEKYRQRKGEKAGGWKDGRTLQKGYYKRIQKEWKKKNIKRVLFLNARRRARKINAEGSHTFGEWELLKKQYGYRCPCCRKSEPEIKLTEDHIVPLIRGGSDYIENIQPLCGSCNCKKHTKIIKFNLYGTKILFI